MLDFGLLGETCGATGEGRLLRSFPLLCSILRSYHEDHCNMGPMTGFSKNVIESYTGYIQVQNELPTSPSSLTVLNSNPGFPAKLENDRM